MTPLHRKILDKFEDEEFFHGEIREAFFGLLVANQWLVEVVTSVMQTSSVGSEKYNWCEEYLAANADLLERIAGGGDDAT